MGSIRIDPRKQFSKKLAKWTAGYWFLIMSWLSVLILLAPGAAMYAVYMAIIATVVMIINVASYTRNSIYEKAIFGLLDKTKLELTLGKGTGKGEDAEEQEGESNG